MEDSQSDEQTVEPDSDEERAYNLAAYRLGRHIQIIDGWLTAVRDIASMPNRPWSWESSYTIFGDSFDSPPLDLITEVNEALRILVRSGAGVVDGASLIELHRAFDSATEGCVSVADLAESDQREEVCEACWGASYDFMVVTQFAGQLLTSNYGILKEWREFGDRLGRFLSYLSHFPAAWNIPEIVTPFLELGCQLVPERMNPVDKLISTVRVARSGAKRLAISGKLLTAIQELDQRVIEGLQKDLVAEPYVVLDDERRIVVFFGVEIPFDEFETANAAGGLSLLRVLIDHPGETLRSSVLVERSKLGLDASNVSSYLTRFRNVIRATGAYWPGEFRSGPEHGKARLAFIVPDRFARKQTVGNKDTWYKLDLPAHRVQHIRPR